MIPADLQVSDRWKLRSKTLLVGRIPLVDGHYQRHARQLFRRRPVSSTPTRPSQHGLRLAAEGADILDIGGESTRPGCRARRRPGRTSPRHARGQRAVPADRPCPSRSTRRSPAWPKRPLSPARRSSTTSPRLADPAMLPLAVEAGCGVCAMHMQGTPQTMQENPLYDDVVAEVLQFLRERRDALLAAGVEPRPHRPGSGHRFRQDHRAQPATCWPMPGDFTALGCPVLVGHSRKRFLGQMRGNNPSVDPTARHHRRGPGPGPAGRANPPRPRRRSRAPAALRLLSQACGRPVMLDACASHDAGATGCQQNLCC